MTTEEHAMFNTNVMIALFKVGNEFTKADVSEETAKLLEKRVRTELVNSIEKEFPNEPESQVRGKTMLLNNRQFIITAVTSFLTCSYLQHQQTLKKEQQS